MWSKLRKIEIIVKPLSKQKTKSRSETDSLIRLAIIVGWVFSILVIASSSVAAGKQSYRLGDYLAGRHAQNIKDHGSAVVFYKSALRGDKDNLNIQTNIFSILISEGRIEEAIPLAEKLIGSGARSDNLATMLLTLQDARQKKYKEALKRLANLPDDGVNVFSAPLLKAWLLAGQKKYKAAISVLEERMSNPGFVALFGPHAALIAELSGDLKTAEKHFSDSLKRFRRVGLGMTRIVGAFYERIGKSEDAKLIYDAFLSRQPNSPLFDQALKRLSSTPPSIPPDLTILQGIAEALYSLSRSFQRQNPFEASLFSRLAIYVNPNFSIAKLRLGDVLLRDNRIEDSIKIYKTITRDRDYGWAAKLRIARSYNYLNQMGKAEEILQRMAAKLLRKTT